jgi:branched-chain amino acid transport system permease protein
MLGAMIAFQLFSAASLPLPLAFVLSILCVALVGFLLQRLAIHPARNAPVVSLIIITIGASMFIRGIVGWRWGKDAVVIPEFSGGGSVSVLGAAVSTQTFWILGTTLGIMLLLHLFFSYTMLGKALRACSINRRAATLMGIDTRIMSLISFSLAAALGAVGGIVTAPLTAPSFDVGVMMGLKGFIAAAIGGFSSQVLAVVGGIGLGIAEALGAGYISSSYKDAFAIAVLFVVLLIRVRRFREGQEEEE